MKTTRLNHDKVNAILSDDSRISDFNRFYITNAVKGYLGLPNEFCPDQTTSKTKLYPKVIDTLKHYDLLIEIDPFYDLFLKSIEAKNALGDDYLKNDNVFNAANITEESKNILDTAINKVSGKKTSTIIAAVEKIREDIIAIRNDNNMTFEEVLNEINE